MTSQLKTLRLRLIPFTNQHLLDLTRLNADITVMRYFPAPYTPERTQKMLETSCEKWVTDGYAFSAIHRLSDNAFLGMAGLSRVKSGIPFAPYTDIGWRLMPSAWGHGYATEAARAWMDYGFRTLKLDRIHAIAPHPNKPSQAVMMRLDMTRRADLDFDHPAIDPSSPLRPIAVYTLERQEFLNKAAF